MYNFGDFRERALCGRPWGKGQRLMQTERLKPQFSLLRMTWPIFVELLLQMLVGNIDQIMLSRYNGTAVAAVGNA